MFSCSLLRNEIEKSLITKRNHIAFKAGDTITVYYKIQEGDKERVQFFKGDVIQRKGSGLTETFTVRKISNGVGVVTRVPWIKDCNSSRFIDNSLNLVILKSDNS